jgi:hypothetical protein
MLMKNVWDWLKLLALIALIIAFFFVPLWLTVGVWKECRAEGHTFWYYVHLVSR